MTMSQAAIKKKHDNMWDIKKKFCEEIKKCALSIWRLILEKGIQTATDCLIPSGDLLLKETIDEPMDD